MGVLACSREGCNNIMCHRYNGNYGYICGDCFNELVDFITLHGGHVTEDLIREFFGTPTQRPKFSPTEDIRQTLETIFPDKGGLR